MTHTITCAPHELSTLTLTQSCDLTLILEENAHCTVQVKNNNSMALTLAINLNGTGATCVTKMAFLLHGTAQAQITTHQIHNAPDTKSNLLIKSVLYDNTQCTYTGTITINETAPRSDATQNSYALLLSPTALAYAHPALEVLTHDVQCAHGAAVASLDLEHLFYLQSRGLGKDSAEQLIVTSFLSEALALF